MKVIGLTVLLFLFSFFVFAQSDTVYIKIKDDIIVNNWGSSKKIKFDIINNSNNDIDLRFLWGIKSNTPIYYSSRPIDSASQYLVYNLNKLGMESCDCEKINFINSLFERYHIRIKKRNKKRITARLQIAILISAWGRAPASCSYLKNGSYKLKIYFKTGDLIVQSNVVNLIINCK